MTTLAAFWLWPYLFAAALVAAWCHWVVPGWRRVREERRNGFRALERIYLRRTGWNR